MKKIGNYKLTDYTNGIGYEVKIYSNIKEADDEDALIGLRYAINFYERKLRKIQEQEIKNEQRTK